MTDTKYLESVEAGIKHVSGHAYPGGRAHHELPEVMIAEGRGSREGCMLSLKLVHEARAILAWFADHDLASFKQESYVASKLEYIRAREFGLDMVREQEYFTFLMSDHAGLLDRWSRIDPVDKYFLRKIDNPNEHLFRHHQMTLALRGSWDLLGRRAQQQLDAQPPKLKRFMVDQRFYLALSRSDQAGMTEALTELTSPKVAKTRNEQLEFGLTRFFIGTHATMYAKIAWRAGFEVQVDTPFIPKEWLPMEPLAKYEDPYPFMRAYDTE